jgi:pimeloyl-ACP methyl ester carboxylesterase
MSLSSTLGEVREARLSAGVIRYRERGSGDAIVFLHGLLVNGDLWRKVVPALARTHRCITPDLPLGSHEIACAPDTDLSIAGVARLVAEFLAALDLRAVTLVANDTGGAIAQVVVTEHPERVGRLVLTSCDAFDNFLPPIFRPLQLLAHVPPLLTAVVQPLRLRALRRLPIAFGWLAKRPIEPAIEDGYLRPFFSDAAVRRDCVKVLRSVSPRYTLAAAEKFGTFTRPVLVAWAAEDRLFPVAFGRRLAAAFPHGRFEAIPDCYTFVSEDQPERLTDLIASFLDASLDDTTILREAGRGAIPLTARH